MTFKTKQERNIEDEQGAVKIFKKVFKWLKREFGELYFVKRYKVTIFH